MKVVIDTNVLLVSIPAKSKLHPIFTRLISGQLTWVITQDILLEYIEILEQRGAANTAFYVESAIKDQPAIISPEIFFNFGLISRDADDNKFVDAYIAASADYLVSNDRHFLELNNIPFPKVNLISAQDFLKMIENNTDL